MDRSSEAAVEAAVERMASELAMLGLRPGGAVLVHSSLRSLGTVPGGAETVVRGLLRALGPEGTLLVPALSYATVTAECPVCDVRTTPSCVGALSEYFRTRAGTMRSVCPTHSVCGAGARAADVLAEHHLDETPCGPNSPYRRLRDAGGQVLFIGCGLRPNTSMHAIEELVEPPYLFADMVSYRVTLVDGTQTTQGCRRHGFAGFAQRYDRLGGLLTRDELREGPLLAATVQLVDAAAMWRRGEEALRRDPLYFVETKT